VICWKDGRGDSGIYAQRLNADGSVSWAAGGVALCNTAGVQTDQAIVSDGGGGAIVTWADGRSGVYYDIYAQRIDDAGAVQWGNNGVAVRTAAGSSYNPSIVPAGSGGAIIAWSDARAGGGMKDIYAQYMSPSGSPQWIANGLALCQADGQQASPVIVSDGAGGAVVSWADERSGGWDIYAERVGPEGQMGGAPILEEVTDVPGDEGRKVSVVWKRSGLDASPLETITHYSVWRSISGQGLAALIASGAQRVSPEQASAGFSGPAYRLTCYAGADYAWEWIADLPAHYFEDYSYAAETLFDSTASSDGYHYFLVSAHTADPFVFWDSYPDSGYSVDNLPPAVPQGLSADIVGEDDLYIYWTPNSEPDLLHYNVYRGSVEDFQPGASNLIAVPEAAYYVDEEFGYGTEYHYKISATDVNGNESECAPLLPGATVAVPEAGSRPQAALYQNTPNPFSGSTRIAFSVDGVARVRLRIFDVRGRLVRTLVDEVRSPGRYVELWRGKDDSGHDMPAAAYLYVLELPGWSARKKLILAE